MNAPFDPTRLLNEKFAIGQPVSRKEDPVLLRGEGRYTDDLNCPGQLYGVMVRSRMAHGEIRSIDTHGAREMPGVHMIITAADLDVAGIKNMPAAAGKHRDGTPTPRPPQRPLATGRVRYVGEPIAMVVAETPKLAKDAAESIFVDIDALPAVTTASAPPRRMRRNCTRTPPAMSASTFTTGTANRSRQPLHEPPTSRNCRSATTVSWSVQWSLDPPSANSIRQRTG